jgi:O-antigen ligase
VDNAYLLILLGSGVLGLGIAGVSYWCFWTFLRKRALASEDHLLQGIAGIFATIPFFSVVNDLPIQTILLLLLALSLRHGDDPVSAVPYPDLQEQHLKLA